MDRIEKDPHPVHMASKSPRAIAVFMLFEVEGRKIRPSFVPSRTAGHNEADPRGGRSVVHSIWLPRNFPW